MRGLYFHKTNPCGIGPISVANMASCMSLSSDAYIVCEHLTAHHFPRERAPRLLRMIPSGQYIICDRNMRALRRTVTQQSRNWTIMKHLGFQVDFYILNNEWMRLNILWKIMKNKPRVLSVEAVGEFNNCFIIHWKITSSLKTYRAKTRLPASMLSLSSIVYV